MSEFGNDLIRALTEAVTHSKDNDADYKAALIEIEIYFIDPPTKGTPEGERFDRLSAAIEAWEGVEL